MRARETEPYITIEKASKRVNAVQIRLNLTAVELLNAERIVFNLDTLSIRIAGIDDRKTLAVSANVIRFTYDNGENLTYLYGKYLIVKEEDVFYLEKIEE